MKAYPVERPSEAPNDICLTLKQAGFDMSKPVDEYKDSLGRTCYVQGWASQAWLRIWKLVRRRIFCS